MSLSSRPPLETLIRSKAQSTGATAPETKPRKVNSEVRKQQNRIASRNYREKRKRKLQQLQQLLEDDDPGEPQMHARSMSPYEDRSCSESIGYERSLASPSPHIATVSGNFQSPQPDHATIANQTWATTVTSSTEQPFPNSHPHPAAYQQAAVYNTSTPATTSYSVWNTIPLTVHTGYSTPDPAHQTLYPSHVSLWSSPGFGNFYPDAVLQQRPVSSTSSYTSSWQHLTSNDFPVGTALDAYGRRYYTYDQS